MPFLLYKKAQRPRGAQVWRDVCVLVVFADDKRYRGITLLQVAIRDDMLPEGRDGAESGVLSVVPGRVVGREVLVDEHRIFPNRHFLTVLGNEGDFATTMVEGHVGDLVVFPGAAVLDVVGDAGDDLGRIMKVRHELLGFLTARDLIDGNLAVEDVVGQAFGILKCHMMLSALDKRNQRVGVYRPAIRSVSPDVIIELGVVVEHVSSSKYNL